MAPPMVPHGPVRSSESSQVTLPSMSFSTIAPAWTSITLSSSLSMSLAASYAWLRFSNVAMMTSRAMVRSSCGGLMGSDDRGEHRGAEDERSSPASVDSGPSAAPPVRDGLVDQPGSPTIDGHGRRDRSRVLARPGVPAFRRLTPNRPDRTTAARPVEMEP